MRAGEWSAERTDEVRHRWEVLGESGGTIAKAMGITRSALIGKVHRMNLTKRGGTPRKTPEERKAAERARWKLRAPILAARKRAERAKARGEEPSPPRSNLRRTIEPSKLKRIRRPILEAGPEPISLDLTVMDLTPRTCRWPHGTGPYRFCGHAMEPGEVYCTHHRARSASYGCTVEERAAAKRNAHAARV